jgi:Tol biopolymer transport system component
MRWLLLATTLLLAGSAAASPEQSRIALWSTRDGDPDVFTVNADGSGAQNIGRVGWGDKRASWSPDGSRIVYDSWNVGHAEFDLWLMNADGSGKTQLTTSPLRDVLPAWSPDGHWIAFTRKRARSTVEDLWLIRPDGTGEHLLTRQASAPAWSPDSRRIVFASRGGDLWVIGADARNRKRLTRSGAFEGPSAGSWSPDGRKILFTRWPLGRFGDVYVLTVRTGATRRLTFARGDDTDPSWSPDGTRIVFDSTRDGNREVYLMNADGSGQRNLTHNPAEDWADTWQPLRR